MPGCLWAVGMVVWFKVVGCGVSWCVSARCGVVVVRCVVVHGVVVWCFMVWWFTVWW